LPFTGSDFEPDLHRQLGSHGLSADWNLLGFWLPHGGSRLKRGPAIEVLKATRTFE
jgi:hypothetical protein